jgi:hypothetical protein
MNTISDNDLILYFYKDGLDDGRIASIAAELQRQPELSARYLALVQTLGEVDALPEILPDEDLTGRVWHSIERRLGPALPEPAPRAGWVERLLSAWGLSLAPRFAAVGACLLALATGIGYYIGHNGANEAGPRESAMAARVLDAYVAEHLRTAEGLLMTAANSDSAGLRAGNSDLAATLVDSNRLYAAAAARSGNVRLADFLRQLEPVLIELANQPADAPVQSLDGLRDYLRKTDLLFQVRATQARIDTAGKHRT